MSVLSDERFIEHLEQVFEDAMRGVAYLGVGVKAVAEAAIAADRAARAEPVVPEEWRDVVEKLSDALADRLGSNSDEWPLVRSARDMLAAAPAPAGEQAGMTDDVSAQHLRLHLGELSASELTLARHAYRLAMRDYAAAGQRAGGGA